MTSDKSFPKIRGKLKPNAAAVDRQGGELNVAKIPNIFFRAEQRIGSAMGRSLFESEISRAL